MKDLSKKDCLTLLSNNYIGRIAYNSKAGNLDIIPITYYYDQDSNSLISYSGEGSKMKAMRKNSAVSFQVDEIATVNKWRSVLVYGNFEELSGIDAKYLLHEFSEGVKKVMKIRENASPKFIGDFSSKISSNRIPVVYRINILEMTGKQSN